MAIVETAVAVVHLLFAGLWTGSVCYFALGVLPLARAGDVGTDPVRRLTDSLVTVTRVSAVVLFLTGGHLAASRYTVDRLTGTGDGHLVLTMLVLWLLLTTVIEIGARTLRSGLDERRLREPARSVRPHFLVAAGLSTLLLIDAGLLMAA